MCLSILSATGFISILFPPSAWVNTGLYPLMSNTLSADQRGGRREESTKMNDAYNTIIQNTPRHELLAQLAEECAELAQAALKLRRTLNPDASPTDVTEDTAEIRFREEVADVLLCIGMATHEDVRTSVTLDIAHTMIYKRERWANRIREVQDNAT